MRTVNASDIFRAVCERMQEHFAKLQAEDWVKLRTALNQALRHGWEIEKWPELLRAEERALRLAWASGTAYIAPTATVAQEVYFILAKKYYQSLQASTGQAPATVSGSTVTENSQYWAECKTAYSANDWATGTVFAVGNQTRNPSDDRYYQCITAHTAGASFDATKFGVLTPFDRYLSKVQTGKTAMGLVYGAYDRNPRVFTNTTEYEVNQSENGGQFMEDVTKVWVEFQARVPRLWGDVFSTTATYTAAVHQIYFTVTAGSAGNFYDCAVTTTAGQSPTTTAASWTIVDLPWWLQEYLIEKTYWHYLVSDGQHDKAGHFAARGAGGTGQGVIAWDALAAAADRELWRQQRQVRRTVILTR